MAMFFGALTAPAKESRYDFTIKIDETSGLSEFPAPGTDKVCILPKYHDPEEEEAELRAAQEKKEDASDESRINVNRLNLFHKNNTLWMPDKICKVCYNCEDPFTMYRRRHHCRICGQIFCDRCSSEVIDGSNIPRLGPGLHRSCKMCHDLILEQNSLTTYTRSKPISNGEGSPSRQISRRNSKSNPSPIFDESVQLKDDSNGDNTTKPRSNTNHSVDVTKASMASLFIRDSSETVVHAKDIEDEDTPDIRETGGRFAVDDLSLLEDARYDQIIQDRANEHLEAIIRRLIITSDISNKAAWTDKVLNLVRDVVSSIDPDVRCGDSLDVLSYVRLKVIPGGSIEECKYVDGIVFRQNVTHKKMLDKREAIKYNPRVLLLAGGIEFQRTDARLSSMDTLIEQEEKYLSILVEKIMYLKPDLIIVGKAVARKAQELLCEHKVAVIQNVKPELLTRIARVTGARIGSSDHMVGQYGEECLGTCRRFYIQCVTDDPERQDRNTGTYAILKSRINRGSTYVYLDGCPVELGCTLMVRGSSRKDLEQIRNVLNVGIVAAYHLRLEVAFYQDRKATLPESSASLALPKYINRQDDSESDGEDLDMEAFETCGLAKGSAAFESVGREEKASGPYIPQASSPHTPVGGKTRSRNRKNHWSYEYLNNPNATLLSQDIRQLLSTSIDIDIGLPYSREIRGLFRRGNSYRRNFRKDSLTDHQTLLFNSLAMRTTDRVQKRKSEVLRIGYYTEEDITLGVFLIDNCFFLSPRSREDGQMNQNQLLSFSHRFGCVTITTHKEEGKLNVMGGARDRTDTGVTTMTGTTQSSKSHNRQMDYTNDTNTTGVDSSDANHGSEERDPYLLPIFMSSYCKRCQRYTVSSTPISDETWKISLGKFMEMMFYNYTAKPRTDMCNHSMRDYHDLIFACEGNVAIFSFTPIHAFSLHVRNDLNFPRTFHYEHNAKVLKDMPTEMVNMQNKFIENLKVLRQRCNQQAWHMNKSDFENCWEAIDVLEQDVIGTTDCLIESIYNVLQELPSTVVGQIDRIQSAEEGARVVPIVRKMTNPTLNSPLMEKTLMGASGGEEDNEGIEAGMTFAETLNNGPTDTIGPHEGTGVTRMGKEESPRPSGTSVDAESFGMRISQAAAVSTRFSIAINVHPTTRLLSKVAKAQPVGGARDNSSIESYSQYNNLEAGAYPLQLNIADQIPQNSDILRRFPLHFKRAYYVKCISWNDHIRNIDAYISFVESQNKDIQGDHEPDVYNEKIVRYQDPNINTDGKDETLHGSSADNAHDDSESRSGVVSSDGAKLQGIDSDNASDMNLPANNNDGSSVAMGEEEMGGDDDTEFGEDEDVEFEPEDSETANQGGNDGAIILKEHDEEVEEEEGNDTSRIKAAGSDDTGDNVASSPDGNTAIHHASSSPGGGPQDRGLVKGLARFLVGDGDVNVAPVRRNAPTVNLKDAFFGDGRLGMPIGKKGEVIPVHEDEFASIIAFSLASESYNQVLQSYISALDGSGVATSKAATNATESVSLQSTDTSGADDMAYRLTDASLQSLTPAHGGVRVSRTIQEDREYEEDTEDEGAGVDNQEKRHESISKDTTGSAAPPSADDLADELNKKMLLSRRITHIKDRFDDRDSKGTTVCKFQCISYWSLQFEAIRRAYFKKGRLNKVNIRAAAKKRKQKLKERKKARQRMTSADTVEDGSDHDERKMGDEDSENGHSNVGGGDDDGGEGQTNSEPVTVEDVEDAESSADDDEDTLEYQDDSIFGNESDEFIQSLFQSTRWYTQGGKSGASFSRSLDGRFVCKVISKIELEMFINFAPYYFEYMANAFYKDLPTVLCKILGVYTLDHVVHGKKKKTQHVVVMEDIFYRRNITKKFDLKGSSRTRYTNVSGSKLELFDDAILRRRMMASEGKDPGVYPNVPQVLLDDNLMELTDGKPFPLKHRAKIFFDKAVGNDTEFLSMVNVVDYSILVGLDENKHEMVIGIIDYMRQYDFLKKMERLGKGGVGVITGQAEPTVVQPQQYCKRFNNAMDQYFMAVPDKWSFTSEGGGGGAKADKSTVVDSVQNEEKDQV